MRWHKFRGLSLVGFCLLVSTFLILAAILVPNFVRARAPHVSPCKSNLKNMGTAMEMYSTDNNGKYPRYPSLLTPNYLKTTPECPTAGRMTYRMSLGRKAPYNTQNYEDYYFVECTGENHLAVSVPAGYPQYNGIVGLIER